jgi:hypothetical protein
LEIRPLAHVLLLIVGTEYGKVVVVVVALVGLLAWMVATKLLLLVISLFQPNKQLQHDG